MFANSGLKSINNDFFFTRDLFRNTRVTGMTSICLQKRENQQQNGRRIILKKKQKRQSMPKEQRVSRIPPRISPPYLILSHSLTRASFDNASPAYKTDRPGSRPILPRSSINNSKTGPVSNEYQAKPKFGAAAIRPKKFRRATCIAELLIINRY